ncbi:MAG: tRNA (adenosine(37)-N6)-threonylcarbamoyltransferase complex dimerization subunit type 1 TsaB [Candidatus Eisenbacteria bacterium]|nr:tRNA (adenosine(37)-N6)-threonylcarbamoyltransferase complex dimerization subunit type 1 TsaB [Candidatus Eisenbacteria bacterium]
MIVLGIETSSRWSGVALASPEGLIGSFHMREGGRTEHLHVLMVRLLEAADLTPESLDGVAVSLGPGSFTGLRIGLGAAKGLALASGCPVAGIPLAPLLAEEVGSEGGRVAVWIDAGRGEVHQTLFLGGSALGPGETAAPDDLLARAAGETALFVGSGALRYRALIRERLGEAGRIPREERHRPDAGRVALRGLERLRIGDGDDPDGLEPLYLRGADAKPPRS